MIPQHLQPTDLYSLQGCQFIQFTTTIPNPPQIPDPRHLKIYKAYDNTFLFHNQSRFWSRNILHIDQNGKVIHKFEAELIWSDLYTISDFEVIFLIRQNNQCIVKQWNFRDDVVFSVPCLKKFGGMSTIVMVCFNQSKMFCIIEYLRNQDRKLQMPIRKQYYKYPLTSNSEKPSHIFEPKKDESLKSSYQPVKFNNHSGIAWVYQSSAISPLTESVYHLFDLRQKKLGFQLVRFQHFFNKSGNQFDAYVADPWEPIEGIIYIRARIRVSHRIGTSYVNKSKALQALLQKQKLCHYLWNYRQNKFQEIKLDSEGQVQFVNGFREISLYQPVSDNSRFLKNPKQFTKPTVPRYKEKTVYYVDPRNSQIVYTQKGRPGTFYHDANKYGQSYLHHEPTIYIKTQQNKKYNRNDSFSFKMVKYRPVSFSLKFIGVFMLEAMIQNADQDLLNEVFNVLSESGQKLGEGWKKLQDTQQNEEQKIAEGETNMEQKEEAQIQI